MAIIIGLALVLLSVGVAVYPFWKQRRGLSRGLTPETVAGPPPLEADLQSVYEAMRTLQLEHELGNIPLGLYREQHQDYRVQAAVILRQQAEVLAGLPPAGPAQGAEWLLEQEIGLVRAALGHVNGPEGENAAACPNCGAATVMSLEMDHPQCPECTAELTVRRCPPETPPEPTAV